MGRLVQQSQAARTDRQHPPGGSRSQLLCSPRGTGYGRVTQTRSPPRFPGRFNFDVDSDLCAARPKSLRYKVMHVPIADDVSDKDESQFSVGRLTPDSPSMPTDVRAIALRADVDQKHQIFRDKYFMGHRLCSDELALRVLSAGCT